MLFEAAALPVKIPPPDTEVVETGQFNLLTVDLRSLTADDSTVPALADTTGGIGGGTPEPEVEVA